LQAFALRRRFSSVSPDTGSARFSRRVLRSEIEKLSEKLSRGPEQMAALRDLWRRASRPAQTRLRKNSRRIILDRALRDKRAMYRARRSEMTVSEIAGRNSARKFVLFPSLASYALNASNSLGRSIDRSIDRERDSALWNKPFYIRMESEVSGPITRERSSIDKLQLSTWERTRWSSIVLKNSPGRENASGCQ